MRAWCGVFFFGKCACPVPEGIMVAGAGIIISKGVSRDYHSCL